MVTKDTLLTINALVAFTQFGLACIAAYLYWKAYKEMKKTAIIGWLAALLTAGAFVGFFSTLFSLFMVTPLLFGIIIARVLLIGTLLMFIKQSLTPEKTIKELEENVIKPANSGKNKK